jgi:hypothetical protein
MAPREGIEPPTNWLTANCSTAELPRNAEKKDVIVKVCSMWFWCAGGKLEIA